MSKIQTYTVAEQLQFLRDGMLRGAYRTMSLAYRKQRELAELALARAASVEAVEQYGDNMFHQTFRELERETMEELADAFNRQAVYEMKAKGRL